MQIGNIISSSYGFLTPEEQLEEYIKTLFPSNINTDTSIVKELVKNFVRDLLDWEKNGKQDDLCSRNQRSQGVQVLGISEKGAPSPEY